MGWFGTLRPPFLMLTPACVSVGIASATASGHPVNVLDGWLCLLGALCAHASVNAFNEHADFVNGLDYLTVRTPFSGGSGTLPAHPELAASTLLAARLLACGSVAIGGWFVSSRGLALLPIGAAGLVLVLGYSRFLVHSALACLIAPGLGFGPLMVAGTAVALTGRADTVTLHASVPVFLVVGNLLLLNQFPDRDADRKVGRRNVVISLGYRRAALVYCAIAASAAGSVAASVALSVLPGASAVALLGLIPCIPAGVAAFRYRGDIESLRPALALNVLASVLTPALLAGGIALG